MGDVGTAQAVAVQTDAAHKGGLLAPAAGFDHQTAALGKTKLGTGHLGRTEHVPPADGIDGIEAEGGEDVPGGELSAVVVAAEAVGTGGVEAAADVTHKELGLGGTAGKGIEVGDVVGGLVAGGIEAEEAGDVGQGAGCGGEAEREEGVEPPAEGLAPAHEADEAGHGVGHGEGVLPGVALGVVAADALGMGQGKGVEGGEPAAVGKAGAEEAGRGAEEVFVEAGAAGVAAGIGAAAEVAGQEGRGVVVVGVLEGRGDGAR